MKTEDKKAFIKLLAQMGIKKGADVKGYDCPDNIKLLSNVKYSNSGKYFYAEASNGAKEWLIADDDFNINLDVIQLITPNNPKQS